MRPTLQAKLIVGSVFAHFGQFGSAQNSSLALGPVNFAGYSNYVLRDNTTAVQAIVSSGTSIPINASVSRPFNAGNRIIYAFVKGNTGTAVYFLPTNGTLSTTFDNATFRSISGANNQTGATAQISLSTDVTIGHAAIGSTRTVRDWTEGKGTEFAIFNYTLGPYNATSVQLYRRWINGTTVQYLTISAVDNLNISVIPNSNVTLPPSVAMTRPNPAANATMQMTVTFNFTGPGSNSTDPVGLGRESLFLTSAPNASQPLLQNTLDAINGPGAAIANQTAFLAYTTEFFAGGWRFLTYFGRDTLITLRLLLPTFSATASEAILRAVIERTRNVTVPGELCHEETIGDYASFINIQNNQSFLGNAPYYDYKMLDTDFLLLPVLSDYLIGSPQGSGRAAAFLDTASTLNTGTLRSLLLLNINHVLNLTSPFANSPIAANLLRIRDATVGNWRDSNTGLGYGTIPFDVNAVFAPVALRAIARMASAGLLPSNYSSIATRQAQVWENNAPAFFEVRNLTATTAAARIASYITSANLTTATIQGAGVLNSSYSASVGYNDRAQIIGSGAPFYALSLRENGTAVDVLNSDLCFALEYSTNVSANVIQAVVQALQPYPRGLLTNIGMVVANAAYSSNSSFAATFANTEYHGAVSWSWQTTMMAKGIARQLQLAGLNNTSLDALPTNSTRPAWSNDATLVSQLQQAQTRLWNSIQGSSSALYAEVYSPLWNNSTQLFDIGDLGAISPSGTEGDAIQLWSYGALGLVNPLTGKAVAGGL